MSSLLASGRVRPANALARRAPAAWGFDEVAGRFVEVMGEARTTIAVGLLRDAQRQGETTAWVASPESCFFPPDLAAWGIDFDALAVIRPAEEAEAALDLEQQPIRLDEAHARRELIRPGGETGDLVNERPFVTREQLEQHWGVDCARLRTELLAAADADVVHDTTPEQSARWRRELALCAAAHNAAADRSVPACPDYARTARALDADAARDHHALQAAIQEALRCDP